MKWNQKTIHAWGIDTFGSAALNTLGLAIRMAKESVELCYQLRIQNETEVKKETADVAIVVLQVANCMSLDVMEVLESSKHYQEIFASLDKEVEDGQHASEILNQYTIDLISALFHAKIDEAKDIIIRIMCLLSVVEEAYAFDLSEEIQAKMEINAARTWKQMPDGSHQHV